MKLQVHQIFKKKLHSQNNLDETDILKERYISPEKRQQIIDELRLA